MASRPNGMDGITTIRLRTTGEVISASLHPGRCVVVTTRETERAAETPRSRSGQPRAWVQPSHLRQCPSEPHGSPLVAPCRRPLRELVGHSTHVRRWPWGHFGIGAGANRCFSTPWCSVIWMVRSSGCQRQRAHINSPATGAPWRRRSTPPHGDARPRSACWWCRRRRRSALGRARPGG